MFVRVYIYICMYVCGHQGHIGKSLGVRGMNENDYGMIARTKLKIE